jgi:hypothetical protein
MPNRPCTHRAADRYREVGFSSSIAQLTTSPFIGTNPTDEPITSRLPVPPRIRCHAVRCLAIAHRPSEGFYSSRRAAMGSSRAARCAGR